MSELKVNKISPATGTAFTLGDSGDTFTVPSGATIVNSGTATGFGGSGKLKQCVQTLYTTQTSSTAAIDQRLTSIPQNTDGVEIMTATLTPTATDSTLLVQAFVKVGPGSDGYRSSIMLYQDSTANALDFCSEMFQSGGDMGWLGLQYKKTSGSTSATTFKVRLASHTGQTVWHNRGSSQATAGGICTSSLVVWEIGA